MSSMNENCFRLSSKPWPEVFFFHQTRFLWGEHFTPSLDDEKSLIVSKCLYHFLFAFLSQTQEKTV